MENAAELSEIEIKKQKKAEYSKRYHAENREKIRERKKEYMKHYNKENAEKKKEWKKNNKDKVKAEKKRYNIKYYNKIINNIGLSSRQFKVALAGWSIAVRERDENMCKKCNSTENLHAHHIFSKIKHPELALSLSNGITLCEICHKEEHKINGLL